MLTDSIKFSALPMTHVKLSRIWASVASLVNVLLLVFFLAMTGPQKYILICGIVMFGSTGFIFLVLKNGYILRRGKTISIKTDPRKFYINIGLLIFIYLIVLLFSCLFYLQEAGIWKP